MNVILVDRTHHAAFVIVVVLEVEGVLATITRVAVLVPLAAGCVSVCVTNVDQQSLSVIKAWNNLKSDSMKKMWSISLILSLWFPMIITADSLQILALFPHNGKSHWYVFRPLIEQLVQRGHNVTVISHFPREKPLANYHDIDLRESKDLHFKATNLDVIGTKSRLSEMKKVLSSGIEGVCKSSLSNLAVQEMIHSTQTFDILITEIFNSDCFLGFVHKFKAPFVALRSGPLTPWSNDRMGTPDNPSYFPVSLGGKPSHMKFLDRLENFIWSNFYKYLYSLYNNEATKIARQHFGEDMPALEEIAKNTSIVLINTFFVHQYAKPVVPGIKEVGGIHIQPNKTLPVSLNKWISEAEHGVIYFSLGSMLHLSTISQTKRQAIFDAFAELPQRILMKWEGTPASNHPKNIRFFEWVPQYDVLCHPNVKVFISHAGMLSSTEAVYSGTPMMAIPAFGDQPTNAALLQERGFSITMQYEDINKDIFLATLKKLLYEPSYQQKAHEMSRLIQDRLVPPDLEAAYWVEYVARYKGAPLLRSPALDLPLYQYLLLDVIAAILLAILALIWVILLLFKLIFRTLCHTIVQEKRKKA